MQKVIAKVELTKGEDGIWMHFEDKRGCKAALNVANTWDGHHIIDGTVRRWAQEQFPKKQRIMPPERAVPKLIEEGWKFSRGCLVESKGAGSIPPNMFGYFGRDLDSLAKIITQEWPPCIIEEVDE